MLIDFRCEKCNQRIVVETGVAEQIVACKACKCQFTVPSMPNPEAPGGLLRNVLDHFRKCYYEPLWVCKRCGKTVEFVLHGMCVDCETLSRNEAKQKQSEISQRVREASQERPEIYQLQQLLDHSKQQAYWLRVIGVAMAVTLLTILVRSCAH